MSAISSPKSLDILHVAQSTLNTIIDSLEKSNEFMLSTNDISEPSYGRFCLLDAGKGSRMDINFVLLSSRPIITKNGTFCRSFKISNEERKKFLAEYPKGRCFSDTDIELVQIQTSASREEAIKELIKRKGDIVNAIMNLT